jgi:uncharacterized protein YegL
MKTRAHITLVVDRSGSMQSIKEEAEVGIRKFIEEQAALDGVKVKVSLYQFDTVYEPVFEVVKAKQAPAYDLVPRYGTALYDAIGKGIEDTKRAIDEAEKKADKVVVVIMTDGAENSSKEHTFDSVTKLVDEQKAAGWEFIFLAGSLESVNFGRQSGLATRGYDPSKRGETVSVYAASSTSTASFLTGESDTTAAPDPVESK